MEELVEASGHRLMLVPVMDIGYERGRAVCGFRSPGEGVGGVHLLTPKVRVPNGGAPRLNAFFYCHMT